VADELVAEFSDPNINIDTPDPDNSSAVRNTTATFFSYTSSTSELVIM
jgi:hypothetical protein